MEKLNVGIIGCGTIANSSHIPSYIANEMADIRYFCDIIPSRAQAAVQEYGCGTAVTDYREVLADPMVDVVSVCTPNDSHMSITVDALKSGKHVLCEKPAARNYQEAMQMRQAQQQYGKILNIGVVNRFNTGVNKLKDMIEAGALGEVYNVYASFRSHRSIPGLGGDFTNKSVSGGGVLIDWGVHFLDIVMYCCGDPAPVSVSCEAFTKLGADIDKYTFVGMWAGPPNKNGVYDVEDSISGIVRTKGPVITIFGAWAQNIGENEMYIDFLGTKAGVRLHYGKDFIQYGTLDGMLTETKYAFTTSNMFQNEIDAFLRCAQTGEKISSNIDTTIITTRLMDAMYQSAAAHKEISLLEESAL